ncbi:MAG: DUF4382 domain-containing protein [Chitinophagales bacterium]
MKLKRSIWLGLLSISLISACIITACNKESSNSSGTTPPGMQKVTVSLNDDPVPNLTSVIIDIRYVEVKVDTGKIHHDDDYYSDDHEGDNPHHEGDEDHHGDHFGKWDTLSITPGLYDLLKLRNGTDTLIANGFSHIGKITKIRITLGSNDSVSTDSIHSFPLPICDGSPYVYANIRSNSIDSLPRGQFAIHIDFNVGKSIEYEGGQYCLRPEIKTYCEKNSGSIEGMVLPWDAHANVIVFNNSDTAYAIPKDEGEFEVRGLSAGSYSVLFKSVSPLPFKDTTLLNIQVQNGMETKLPTITLHQ